MQSGIYAANSVSMRDSPPLSLFSLSLAVFFLIYYKLHFAVGCRERESEKTEKIERMTEGNRK